MKNALVTGGGTGIGRATALALAADGCRVVVVGDVVETLQQTTNDIRGRGREADFVVCDVRDAASVRAACEQACDVHGLDIAVNSAGVSGGDAPAPCADYDIDRFDDILAIDLRGLFVCMKYELQAMRASGGGVIVNVGSGASVVGVGGFAGYVAAKHGVLGLTRAAAIDHARDGVRVNAVIAGLVDSPLTADRPADVKAARIAAHPIGRIARPEEIADAIVWLCSDRSSFVTGAGVAVDGGYTAW
jgi:NAD(P)-dependent dehydrogenase (short-subunit alcohol dehydrogenase family)